VSVEAAEHRLGPAGGEFEAGVMGHPSSLWRQSFGSSRTRAGSGSQRSPAKPQDLSFAARQAVVRPAKLES